MLSREIGVVVVRAVRASVRTGAVAVMSRRSASSAVGRRARMRSW
jgi:hypothetical protein